MSDIIAGPLAYPQLAELLQQRGYQFWRIVNVLDEVGREYGMVDEHDEFTRGFGTSLIIEVMNRLGAAPKKTGRKYIGPEVKTRLSKEEIAELNRRAEAAGMGRSDLIRRYLQERLATPEIPPV